MAALNSVTIRCSLPTERGDESTDIVVLRMGDSIVYILATTAPNDVVLTFPPELNAKDMNSWPSYVSPQMAKNMVLWATKWVKDPHIRTNCVLGAEMERMREFILSVASVAFIHPSAVYDSSTQMFPASVKSVDEVDGKIRVALKSPMPVSEQSERTRTVEGMQGRPASIIAWASPFSDTSQVLRVPCPTIMARTMNVTVVVMGSLVNSKSSSLYTYIVDVPQAGRSEIVSAVDTSKAAITYIPDCQDVMMPYGINYPTNLMQGIDSGRCVLMLSGTKSIDATDLGFVRFAQYNGMCVPLVCGCAVRDSVRFERAHIPLTFLPNSRTTYQFEDTTYGKIRLRENEVVIGQIDISKKEKHGDVWWVSLVK
jgi:hypothetical protein